MVGRDAGGSGPPDFRRGLAEALALAAQGSTAPVPFPYLLDLVARRYGLAPWDLRDAPYEDVMRAIHIMNVEGQARSQHG
jgi:hypothetical protein